MTTKPYQPKTGAPCTCEKGVQRNNCPQCEGTGWQIDFAMIRARTQANLSKPLVTIEFTDVGRYHWSGRMTTAGDLSRDMLEATAIAFLRQSGALLSRSITLDWNEDNSSGEVLAGFRTVGRFTIIPS